MKKVFGSIIVLLIMLTFLVLPICGCTGGTVVSGAEELSAVEITEYEGEKLSSIDQFRENSIRGPQHIDVDSYHLTGTL